MAGVLALLFLLSIVLLIWGLISPSHLSKTARLPKPMARSHVGLAFGIAVFLLLILIGVTGPTQPKTVSVKTTSSKTSNASEPVQPTITTKTVTTTQPVAYTTKTEDSNSLDKGQTKTVQAGKDGSETLTYNVTYTNGRQTNKTLVSTVVTTQPIQEIVEDGTYAAPAPTPSSSSTASTPSTSTSPSSSCYPLSDEGTCYEPGEYCRDSDAGTTGVAGDGESITCENNDGLRWEPN